ncbi:MAG: DUF6314 family protein [Pelagimonas sp.]|nr:DUF6314 family protein [Pelagimonas sp.]
MVGLTLNDFLGDWHLTREIQHGDGAQASFEGQARWIADAGGADYRESGQLQMPGQGAFQAERRYRWDADLRVFFDDGRFFHSVPPLGGDSAHWCDPDQYDATYAFCDWPNWSCRWRVRGPRKDYTMTSRYCPK